MLIRLVLIISLLLSSCQSAGLKSIPFDIQFHPDGKLYVGDLISFEVIPDAAWISAGKQVEVGFEDRELGIQEFGKKGIGQRQQATFTWVLDTTDLEYGDHDLTFSILPEGPTWTETIHLYPQTKNPYLTAEWNTVQTDCCLLRYISGTDAARDISYLSTVADTQADDVENKLNTDINRPISITFIPRLIGQGGFASNGIYLTYFDGNITGNISTQVIHHEMVHILDASLGDGGKPALLVEGLAVYLSGGHYKQEDLLVRAASLFDLDAYIPFEQLLGDFYAQQHEIGYLEAGALVEFMVARYGWDSFKDFYAGIDSNGGEGSSLEVVLEKMFATDLGQLEQDFIQFIQSHKADEFQINDLKLTIDLYDSIRLYQQKLDPSAYFATAWLPDGDVMQEKGIVADFLRTREGLDVVLIETLLRIASRQIFSGDYKQAASILELANIFLNFYP